MKKIKILYMMHVHWSWIKQRPHFLAEFLAEKYDVTVCFNKTYKTTTTNFRQSESDLKFTELFVLPFNRLSLVCKINKWLINRQLSGILNDYDMVWVTHPDLYASARSYLPHKTLVVYDCMDDALEFPLAVNNLSVRNSIEHAERGLIARSDILIASSMHLRDKLLTRYTIEKNVHVVNNAVNVYGASSDCDLDLPVRLKRALSDNRTKKILYIGTISSWIDLDVIVESVNRYTGISYILIGPTDVVIPQHDRIIYIPPVQHKYIFAIMKLVDALVMPFLINELVLSVNPVKIYEYIYSLKPAIVCKYEETEKFSDYVQLYDTNDAYYKLIELLLVGELNLKTQCDNYLAFALRNTWNERAHDIFEILALQCDPP